MMKKLSLTIKQRNAITGYLFILPWIIGFLVFTLYPLILSIRLSFNEVRISEGILLKFRGWEYYHEALNVDTQFKTNLGETVIFICCAIPIIIVFSLIIAMLLNGRYPLRTLFRGIFFLPVIIMSGPVISDLMSQYSVDLSKLSPLIYDFINNLPGFIKTPIFFSLNNLVLILWFSGVQILLFLAGLQKIGKEIYEAASIDGATGWEKFWKITLPHLKPMALINSVYTVMEIANYANNSVNTKISSHLLEVNRPYSFSAAMSWIYFMVILLLLLAVYIIFNGWKRRDKE